MAAIAGRLESLQALCKQRSFAQLSCAQFGSSLAGAHDYGALGSALKRRVERRWWRTFVERVRFAHNLECSKTPKTRAC